jgi:hypothetical protein
MSRQTFAQWGFLRPSTHSHTYTPPAASGHGIFTHFLNGLQNEFGRNSLGKNSTWEECVNQFDVEAYAAEAAATGAK